METTHMPIKHSDADIKLPAGICGADNTDTNKSMSKPVWATLMACVDDFFKHMREVGQQPDKHDVSGQSDISHQCPRHTERNCNCTNDTCADDDIGEQRDKLIRDIHKHYDGRSAGQQHKADGTGKCDNCNSKHVSVCLGRGKECQFHEEAGSDKK